MTRGITVAALACLELFASTAEAQPKAAEPQLRPGRTPRTRESVLQLSGEIGLGVVEALVRQRLPAKKRWKAAPYTHPINGGAGTLDGISVGYDIVAGTATVGADRSGRIVTRIPVSYNVWARYQAIRGGPTVDARCLNRAAQIVLTTTLNVRASRLTPSTRASVYAANRCVVTALRIDVTDQLTSFLGTKLRNVASEVDQKVADSLKLDGAASLLWARLLRPKQTAGGWLDLDPRAIQVRPVSLEGKALRATIQVIAKSALRHEKPESRTTAMPAIDSHSSPARISLLVEVAVDPKALDRRATAAARGAAGIRALVLRPRGRFVAIGADVDKVGRVWMTGELGAPDDYGVLAVRELRWSAESDRMLGRKAAAIQSAIARVMAKVEFGELAGIRSRAQDALGEGLGNAVPLLSGAAAIERISLASAVRRDARVHFYFRAEGAALDRSTCRIRRGAVITATKARCSRAAIAKVCKRPCEYSTDGKTWLRAR